MPKILIIDDEPFTIDMLETFLKLHGYETAGAMTGEDGLLLVRIESPDIVLLDLMLPDVQGFDVCRRLRAYPPTTRLPVLILSALSSQADRDRAFSAGANGYLTKPVQFPQLLAELDRILKNGSHP